MIRYKYKITAVFALIAILILAGCAGNTDPDVYAVVNGEEITREEFQQYASLMLFEPGLELTDEERLLVLESLISEKVYLAEAINRGYELDADQAKEDYEQFRDEAIRQLFSGSSSMYYNHLQELDLTETVIASFIERVQLINAMVADEQDKVEEPSDEAIEAFYEKEKDNMFAKPESRRVRHILINDGNFPDADEEEIPELSEELAQELYQRLLDGEDFAELAEEYSQCPSSEDGGDLGHIEKNDVVKEFGEVAFSVELDEIAEPVESQFGWHIIEVTEIQEPGYYELDDQVRAWIFDQLHGKEMEAAAETLLASLMEIAVIQNNLVK